MESSLGWDFLCDSFQEEMSRFVCQFVQWNYGISHQSNISWHGKMLYCMKPVPVETTFDSRNAISGNSSPTCMWADNIHNKLAHLSSCNGGIWFLWVMHKMHIIICMHNIICMWLMKKFIGHIPNSTCRHRYNFYNE